MSYVLAFLNSKHASGGLMHETINTIEQRHCAHPESRYFVYAPTNYDCIVREPSIIDNEGCLSHNPAPTILSDCSIGSVIPCRNCPTTYVTACQCHCGGGAPR